MTFRKEVTESLLLLPASAVSFVTANLTILRSFFGRSFTLALPRPDNEDSETLSSACDSNSSLFGVFVVEIRLYLEVSSRAGFDIDPFRLEVARRLPLPCVSMSDEEDEAVIAQRQLYGTLIGILLYSAGKPGLDC
ncbi:hypothetical protein ABG067_006921 [Albugo candida]